MSDYIPTADRPFMFFNVKDFSISSEGGIKVTGEFLMLIPLGPHVTTGPGAPAEKGIKIVPIMKEPAEWIIPKQLIPHNRAITDLSARDAMNIIVDMFSDTPVSCIPPAPFDVYNIPPSQRHKVKHAWEQTLKQEFNDERTM